MEKGVKSKKRKMITLTYDKSPENLPPYNTFQMKSKAKVATMMP
jgi:hypothetical protein